MKAARSACELLGFGLLALLAACDDFDLPSALTHPQVLAVRSTPAQVAAGGEARLDALVAGPDGPMAMPLAWRLAAGPGLTLAGDTLVAAADARAVALVGLDAGGLLAEKDVAIGAVAVANPELTAVAVDGAAVGDELHVVRGRAVSLAASVAAAEPTVSWYATVGELDAYRHNPTTLQAPEETGDGWLIVVGRDGAGGVAWRVLRLRVD